MADTSFEGLTFTPYIPGNKLFPKEFIVIIPLYGENNYMLYPKNNITVGVSLYNPDTQCALLQIGTFTQENYSLITLKQPQNKFTNLDITFSNSKNIYTDNSLHFNMSLLDENPKLSTSNYTITYYIFDLSQDYDQETVEEFFTITNIQLLDQDSLPQPDLSEYTPTVIPVQKGTMVTTPTQNYIYGNNGWDSYGAPTITEKETELFVRAFIYKENIEENNNSDEDNSDIKQGR